MTITSEIRTNGNYKVYGSSQTNLVNWLTTESNWNAYASGFSGATATGGPTKAQFCESYNVKYGTSYSNALGIDTGFTVTNKVIPYIITSVAKADAYWLASVYSDNTNGVWRVLYGGGVGAYEYNYVHFGIRPLVKLPANAKMNWNGTAWDLAQ